VLLPSRRELAQDGSPVPLAPKAFDLLLMLVEERHRVVSKSELMDRLWPDTAVEEAGLTQLVFLVRRALSRNDDGERFIATVPRRGYRFVADVEALDETPAPVAEPAAIPRRSARLSTVALIALAGVLAALAALRWLTGGTPPDAVPHQYVKLTSSSGVNLWPSVSPDGKWVLYTATKSYGDEPEQIYLQAIGGLSPVCLTCETTGRKLSPVFSPDGARIAFALGQGEGGIFVMARDGSSPRRLTNRGFHPAWSPRGDEIAFTTRRTDWIPVEAYYSTSELWIVNVASEQSRRLNLEDARDPAWSPDGRWIAFWTKGASGWRRDLFVVPAAGGTPRRVAEEAHNWNPVWAVDGSALYFLSNRDGHRGLWRAPVERGSGNVTSPAEPVTLPTAFVSYPRTGPGGTVVYSDVRTASNVSVLSFDAATATIGGPPRPVTTGTRFWLPPHPSPDGQWIALAQASISDPEDIFAVERDGTRLRHLTNDEYHDRDPQVSPNGRLVAFASDRGGRWGLWVISADGGQLRPLTAATGAHDWTRPHWSPDGAFVAAWEEPGHRTVIFDASRENSAPHAVVPPLPHGPTESISIDADHRAWSPDGRRLALRSGDLLAIYSLDSGTYRTAAIDGGILGWIPAGPQLLLNQRWSRRFLLVDTNTWHTTVVDYPSFIPPGDVRFGLSADGRTLAMVHATFAADVWLMNSPRR
jgi:Tol biopolymer transport system component/DNA-binding winged helix-turn-helix (wHTH) protein